MQGTTPRITLTISTDDFLLSNVTEIEFYVQNGGRTTVTTLDDLLVDTAENTVTKEFSEAETAALTPRTPVEVQARFHFADGSIVGINKVRLAVADMLGVGD